MRIALTWLTLIFVLLRVQLARAQDVIPPPPELPAKLSLGEAVRIFRTRGLDLLIAQANVKSAEGAVKIAGAVPNPQLSAGVGNAITYANTNFGHSDCLKNGAACSPWVYNLGITDSAALETALSGKLDLRVKVARAALAAAKMTRVDAERTILFQVKSAYLQVALAKLVYEFTLEVAASNKTTLEKFQARFSNGAINEADLQRIETQKLESDQAVDAAIQNLSAARYALAFLLGVRGKVTDFEVETGVLDFAVPPVLREPSDVQLLRLAFDNRPDLVSFGYLRASAEAQIQLVRRQRTIPDVTLGLNYSWGGFGGLSTNGPVGPQIVTLSISTPIPMFYQYDGELRMAQAAYEANSLAQAKVTTQVVNDVTTSLAAFVAARKLVERMEGPRRDGGGLLKSARGAFEITAIQYGKGAANLTDYLDSLRTYIATKIEYFSDLASYWTAVFQLEAAIATDLSS